MRQLIAVVRKEAGAKSLSVTGEAALASLQTAIDATRLASELDGA